MVRYERSGLTAREFCEQAGLVPHQFAWWRAELKRRGVKGPGRKIRTKRARHAVGEERARGRRRGLASEFVRLHVNSLTPAKGSIEIVLSDPPRIAVTPGFDAESLVQVVRALENHRC
jgi:hypothetical protein